MSFQAINAPAWVADALCAQTDPEAFHPTRSDASAAAAAKKVCSRCPVREQCLATALADPSLDGVWGGTSYRQRQKLRKIRGRGVPATGRTAAA